MYFPNPDRRKMGPDAPPSRPVTPFVSSDPILVRLAPWCCSCRGLRLVVLYFSCRSPDRGSTAWCGGSIVNVEAFFYHLHP